MKTLERICIALLLVLGVAMSGCNTARGVGQDVEKAGNEIQDAAD
jgi:predicted small secreted protein